MSNIDDVTSPPNFNDPFFDQQWQTNQNSLYHLNIQGAWADYSGAGVFVAIADNGVDYHHPEFQFRYNFDADLDLVTEERDGDEFLGNDVDGDGSPDGVGRFDGGYKHGGALEPDDGGGGTRRWEGADDHGTPVAGIIAAAANNGEGGVGVAFNSEITSYRVLAQNGPEDGFNSASAWNQDAIDQYNQSAIDHGVDIINASIAQQYLKHQSFPFENFVVNGRDGLGGIFVKAAGNFRSVGWDANSDPHSSTRRAIVVAAVQRDGEFAGYSQAGANVLVSGLTDWNLATDPADNNPMGRNAGRNGREGNYGFFDGTSAAAPTISGVAALILEANPELGYRDVQDIFAYSSRMTTDSSIASYQINGASDWNGGGLHFSHDYGYGLVDATAAVRLAESWKSKPAKTAANEVEKAHTLQSHEFNNGFTPDVDGEIEIETIEITVKMANAPIDSAVITLISPDGTESRLLNRPPVRVPVFDEEGNPILDANGNQATELVDYLQNGFNYTFMTQAHRGEVLNGEGVWRVSITTAEGVGVIEETTVRFFGASQDINDDYIYTDEFARLNAITSLETLEQRAEREILIDDDQQGHDRINAAAITGDSVINLNEGATSTLDGVHGRRSFTIAEGTQIEDAYAGDGNDLLIGNARDNVLHGARGNDFLVGGGGVDRLEGGRGIDTYDLDYQLNFPYSNVTIADTGISVIDVSGLGGVYNYTIDDSDLLLSYAGGEARILDFIGDESSRVFIENEAGVFSGSFEALSGGLGLTPAFEPEPLPGLQALYVDFGSTSILDAQLRANPNIVNSYDASRDVAARLQDSGGGGANATNAAQQQVAGGIHWRGDDELADGYESTLLDDWRLWSGSTSAQLKDLLKKRESLISDYDDRDAQVASLRDAGFAQIADGYDDWLVNEIQGFVNATTNLGYVFHKSLDNLKTFKDSATHRHDHTGDDDARTVLEGVIRDVDVAINEAEALFAQAFPIEGESETFRANQRSAGLIALDDIPVEAGEQPIVYDKIVEVKAPETIDQVFRDIVDFAEIQAGAGGFAIRFVGADPEIVSFSAYTHSGQEYLRGERGFYDGLEENQWSERFTTSGEARFSATVHNVDQPATVSVQVLFGDGNGEVSHFAAVDLLIAGGAPARPWSVPQFQSSALLGDDDAGGIVPPGGSREFVTADPVGPVKFANSNDDGDAGNAGAGISTDAAAASLSDRILSQHTTDTAVFGSGLVSTQSTVGGAVAAQLRAVDASSSDLLLAGGFGNSLVQIDATRQNAFVAQQSRFGSGGAALGANAQAHGGASYGIAAALDDQSISSGPDKIALTATGSQSAQVGYKVVGSAEPALNAAISDHAVVTSKNMTSNTAADDHVTEKDYNLMMGDALVQKSLTDKLTATATNTSEFGLSSNQSVFKTAGVAFGE